MFYESDSGSGGNRNGSGSDDGGEVRPKKKKKRGIRRSAFWRVIQPRKGREVADLERHKRNNKINASKKGNMEKRTLDKRYLTLRQMMLALDKKILDEMTFCKLEAADPGLHGITVGKEGGTVVESRELDWKGRVVDCGLDAKGYKEFTIKWEKEGVDDGKYSTYRVIRCAMEGEAESLDSTVAYMTNCLVAILCLVNTHGKESMVTPCKRDVVPKTLKKDGRMHKLAQRVRKKAWERMCDLTANRTMSGASLKLRDNFHGTMAELEKTKLSRVLYLSDGENPDVKDKPVGFMNPEQYDKDFNKKQAKGVNEWVQAFQSAIAVGRPVCMESILFPMTPAEVPPGTTIASDEVWLGKVRVEKKKAEAHGVAVKSILARAGDEESPVFEWSMHFPLYRLKLLTRPQGALKPSTESTGKVAKIRKFPKFYEESISLVKNTKAMELDQALVQEIDKKYVKNVAPRIKRAHNSFDYRKKRHGRGSNFDNGRMHETGSRVWEENIVFLREVASENCFTRLMKELTDDEIEMCMDVLRLADIPKMDDETEAHLMPPELKPEIEAIVERLKSRGVTRGDVAAFSWGLVTMDAVMNAILRPQDLLGMIAGLVYMISERAPTGEIGYVMEAPLPAFYKNDEAMNRSVMGGDHCHIKDPEMHEWMVVMLVILRPLMRDLLAHFHKEQLEKGNLEPGDEEAKLCDELGPFDKDGKCFTVQKLQNFFQYIGKSLIALPHCGYNILRTTSLSDVAFLALANGDPMDAPFIKRKLAAMRTSHEQFNRTYNAVLGRVHRVDPNSLDSRIAGMAAVHSERARVTAGSSSGSSSPEASQRELDKAKAEKDDLALKVAKLEDEKAGVLRKVEEQRERIMQLEKEISDVQPRPQSGPQSQPQPESQPALESESEEEKEQQEETPVGTIAAEKGGKKRATDNEDEQPRRAKKAKSSGADGRKKPLDPARLVLVKEMHACLKKMSDSVDRSKSYPLNSFEGAVRNIDSQSAPFAATTRARMASDHKELSDRFYKSFQRRTQLDRYYKELKIGVEK